MPAFLGIWTTTVAAAILWWSWLAAAEKQNIVYWSRPRKEFTCRVDFTLKISLTRDDCGNDDKYGGCAYAPNAVNPRLWCCPPGDAACWGWGQACLVGRKECRSGTSTWCCDGEYEDCEYEFNKVNLCLLKTSLFPNPLSGAPTTVEPTMTDTMTTATVEIAATAVIEPTETDSLQSSNGRPTGERLITSVPSAAPSEGGLSKGAAVGAGVGGVLGFIAIVAGVFFAMQRRRQRLSEEMGMGFAGSGISQPSWLSPHGRGLAVISECADTPAHGRHELGTKPWNHELQANSLMELEGTQMPAEAATPVPSVAGTRAPST